MSSSAAAATAASGAGAGASSGPGPGGGAGRLTLSDAAKAVYREGGPRAFFRGNGANVVKVIPETATKFVAFDILKRRLAQDPGNATVAERFAAGGLAGAAAQTLVYPLEIVKTRMAVSSPGTYGSIYGTMVGPSTGCVVLLITLASWLLTCYSVSERNESNTLTFHFACYVGTVHRGVHRGGGRARGSVPRVGAEPGWDLSLRRHRPDGQLGAEGGADGAVPAAGGRARGGGAAG
jgi:hypothetical protein